MDDDTRLTDEERAAVECTIKALEVEDEPANLTACPREFRLGPLAYYRYFGVTELTFRLLGLEVEAVLYKPNHVVIDGAAEGGDIALGTGRFSRWLPTPFARLSLQLPGLTLSASFLVRLPVGDGGCACCDGQGDE